jgi:hypothetical protein
MGSAWPKLVALLGHWGAPTDGPALVATVVGALLLGVAALDGGGRRSHELFPAAPSRGFAGVLGLAAAFLSLGYVAHYLRGGPRIIDATHYFLQARALAEGHVAWDVPMPSASFRGRFLVSDGSHVAGIFPPGWPLLLSLGFRIGAPLVVGPLLALGLVFVTRSLALAVGEAAGLPRRDAERAARVAAVLSFACAALRYHTADTMAHGATALGVALAMRALLEARRAPSRARFALVGLALGAVLSTRMASSFAPALVALSVAARAPRPLRHGLWLAAGALPGALFLALAAKASTGSAFVLPQTLYYATADGPPGCFRYGFGQGIGCLVEHGDFVHARLAGGYGALEALGTTLRRLHMHADDVLDAWPLGLFVALPAMIRAARREPAARLLAAAALLHVLAYAPFYFDGNYPGGGARLFADVLPLEHVLIAVGLAPTATELPRRALALLGAMLVGFGVHGAFGHAQLAARDGGRPMVIPEELPSRTGLLFVDTDHAFALLHAPGADPTRELVVARLRDDAHDRLLHDRLGRPPTLVHRFRDGSPTVEWWTPPPATDILGHEVWRFEAEAEWPPLAQSGGWASPTWASGTCASASRVLEVLPSSAEARITLALPVPHAGRWRLAVTAFLRGNGAQGTLLVRGPGGGELGRVDWADPVLPGPPTCVEAGAPVLDLPEGEWRLELVARGAPIALDKVLLTVDPGPR